MKPVVLLLLLAGIATVTVAADEKPQLSIDSKRVTVSGMSSGAQMAHQLHLAYSDLFSGVGLLAGGPFGCAEGSVLNALNRCLAKPGTEIPLVKLKETVLAASSNGRLADLSNLADDPVWIFHGSLDQAVPASVNEALVELYSGLVPAQQLTVITNIPAAHTFPADGAGGACDQVESPYVGNCAYDAAGALLQTLYPQAQAPQAQVMGEETHNHLKKIPLPGASAALLDEYAYLFLPPACYEPKANCALHLVLHGCGQSASQVGTAFMEQSGYLRWAEANNIVLAFPQVIASGTNPLACWDWWGYSGADYLWREGRQMKALTNWIKQLAGL